MSILFDMQSRILAYLDSSINPHSKTTCFQTLTAIVHVQASYSHQWGLSRMRTFFRPGPHMPDYNGNCMRDI